MAAEILTSADPFIAELEPSVVRFLGPKFSYSEIMATTMFGTDAEAPIRRGNWRAPNYIAHPNFSEVTEGVYHDESNNLTVGILPVENTQTSPVQPVTDALLTGDFFVLGEGSLLIRLVLASNGESVEKVRTIYSQSKPFYQARDLLSRRYYKRVEVDSTSAAAQYVAEKGEEEAALCSRRAAEHANLNILETDVQDDPNNQTRFLVVQSRNGRYHPDLEMLRNRRLASAQRAVVSGIVSPTKPADEDGFFQAMHRLRDMNIHSMQVGRRNTQHEPAGGDSDYFVRFNAPPRTLWEVLKDERNYREKMRFNLLGVYAVGSLYSE